MTEERSRERGWGITIGLLVGIVLVVLSLSKLPFLGEPSPEKTAIRIFHRADNDRIGEPLPSARQSWSLDHDRNRLALPQALPSLPSRSDSFNRAAPSGVASRELSPSVPPAEYATVPAKSALVTIPVLGAAPARSARMPTNDEPRSPSSVPSLPSTESDSGSEGPQALLAQARFLIKAGLAPMAAESLRKVVREAPGTPVAQEAQQTLDSLSRN